MINLSASNGEELCRVPAKELYWRFCCEWSWVATNRHNVTQIGLGNTPGWGDLSHVPGNQCVGNSKVSEKKKVSEKNRVRIGKCHNKKMSYQVLVSEKKKMSINNIVLGAAVYQLGKISFCTITEVNQC